MFSVLAFLHFSFLLCELERGMGERVADNLTLSFDNKDAVLCAGVVLIAIEAKEAL